MKCQQKWSLKGKQTTPAVRGEVPYLNVEYLNLTLIILIKLCSVAAADDPSRTQHATGFTPASLPDTTLTFFYPGLGMALHAVAE